MVWAQAHHTPVIPVGGGKALPHEQHFMAVAILKSQAHKREAVEFQAHKCDGLLNLSQI